MTVRWAPLAALALMAGCGSAPEPRAVVASGGAPRPGREVPVDILGVGPSGATTVVASDRSLLALGGVDPATAGGDGPLLRDASTLVDLASGGSTMVPHPRVAGRLVHLLAATSTADGFAAIGPVCKAERAGEGGAGCETGPAALYELPEGETSWRPLDDHGAFDGASLASAWYFDVLDSGGLVAGAGVEREGRFAFELIHIGADGRTSRQSAPAGVHQACATRDRVYLLGRSVDGGDPLTSTTTFSMVSTDPAEGTSRPETLPALDGRFGGASVRLGCSGDAPYLASSPGPRSEVLWELRQERWHAVEGVFRSDEIELVASLHGGEAGVVVEVAPPLSNANLEPPSRPVAAGPRGVRQLGGAPLPEGTRMILDADGRRLIVVRPSDARDRDGRPTSAVLTVEEAF